MKKILMLSIAAFMVMGLVGGGTWAFFSDTETSTGNIFTAGTMDLQVSNDASTYTNGVTATWGDASNPVYPGYSGSGNVTVKSVGTLAGDHVEIGFSNTVTDYASYNATDLGANIADMADNITITAMSWNGTSILASATTEFDANQGNNDGTLVLSELDGKVLNATTLGSALAAPAAGGTITFGMTVEIPSSVGNGIQGDEVTTTVTFALYQDSSQHLTLP